MDNPTHEQRERGFTTGEMGEEKRGISFGKVVLFLVVLLVAYSAVQSQIAANKSTETSDSLIEAARVRDRENACTSQILFGTVQALNERTSYTTAQALANVKLQKSQAEFLTTLRQDRPEEDGQRALTRYVESLTEFINAATANATNAQTSPYPTQVQYASCLQQARIPNKEK